MEIHFGTLLLCAFLGFYLSEKLGYDSWKLYGSLSLVILQLPFFLIVPQGNPEAMGVVSYNYIDAVIRELPSMIIGELAGIFALKLLKTIGRNLK